MKEEATIDGARLTADEREAVTAARTVIEFDDSFVALRHGFRDAADYYRQSYTIDRLPEISVPTLVIHARNDPWIPAGALCDGEVGSVRVVLTGGGGHVGFHARGSDVPWHDRYMEVFARAYLAPQGVTCP